MKLPYTKSKLGLFVQCLAVVITQTDFFHYHLFREKFGLHRVDFDDPARKRTPKASAKFFREIVSNNGFIRP